MEDDSWENGRSTLVVNAGFSSTPSLITRGCILFEWQVNGVDA